MQRVNKHDFVTVLYEGTLADGEVFESSDDTGPLSFQTGTQAVLPAFEQAVLGMSVGEKKQITLSPEEAYGPHREELLLTLPREHFAIQDLKPGMVLGVDLEREGREQKVPAMVTRITAKEVTVDFNHPLAGQELTYTITVQAVEPAESERQNH